MPRLGWQAAQRLLRIDAPAVCQIDDRLKVHVHIFFDAALQPRVAQPRNSAMNGTALSSSRAGDCCAASLHHGHQRQSQHLLVHVLRQLLHQRQHSVWVWQPEHPRVAPMRMPSNAPSRGECGVLRI